METRTFGRTGRQVSAPGYGGGVSETIVGRALGAEGVGVLRNPVVPESRG